MIANTEIVLDPNNSVIKRLWSILQKNKGADQLRGNWAADLRLCFFTYAKIRSSHDMAYLSLVM